jgi:type II secretory pathway component GspD/PulD (secretin)
LVEDRESILQKVDNIVAELDVQPTQVLIEAVILYVTHTNSSNIGINYGIVDGGGHVLGVVGNGAAINAATGFNPISPVVNGLLNTPASTGGTSGGSSSSSGTGTGFAANTAGLNFGNANGGVTSFISLLQTIGKVEVLASPRLLVINKQLAELQLGDRLGYSTISQSIVSTTQQISFMNVGTLLRVRPFIASDGMIRMEVHPERSTGAIVGGIPQASTSEVTTNVMVPDGATLLIGGLMDKQVSVDQSGIPWLSTLPHVGALFRTRNTSVNTRELVVLLTTRIWDPSQQMAPYQECFPSRNVMTATEPEKIPDIHQGKF